MLTLLSTGKPFDGHSGIIQRNALKSWTLLHPDIEIILFGSDEGASDVARELGIRHESHVERNELGRKRLDFMFNRAQVIARHDILCYINCDIILMPEFCYAVDLVRQAIKQFLMVGRRWDIDVLEPIDFSRPIWEEEVRQCAIKTNKQRDSWWIDYFVFPRGLYSREIPPLAIGSIYWDNWLIWRAGRLGASVVDSSEVVYAVHQNHDYGHHPLGRQGVWSDAQSRLNFQHAGGYKHLRTIESAKFRLTDRGLVRNPFSWYPHLRITMERHTRPMRLFLQTFLWHPLLNVTRPLRHSVGLKQRDFIPGFLRRRTR